MSEDTLTGPAGPAPAAEAPGNTPQLPAPLKDGPPRDGKVHACDGGIKVWLAEQGIMRVKLPENAEVAGRHAADAADAVRLVADGRRYPMLLDLTKVKSVSRQARSVYGHPVSVTAYALLGEGPVDRVLAHYFLGASPLDIPAQFFESESDALQWLGTYSDGK